MRPASSVPNSFAASAAVLRTHSTRPYSLPQFCAGDEPLEIKPKPPDWIRIRPGPLDYALQSPSHGAEPAGRDPMPYPNLHQATLPLRVSRQTLPFGLGGLCFRSSEAEFPADRNAREH